MGRLSTGLYVVTAAHDNAKSAMVASWVQQASFKPLGLTIAIAKDRAIEALLQVGLAQAPVPVGDSRGPAQSKVLDSACLATPWR